MRLRFTTSVAFAVAILLTACDEDTGTIGTILTDNVDHLEVTSASFRASSRSVAAGSILSRSSVGYLGRIKDPETSSFITTDFMTQFNCMESYMLTPIDSVASIDDNGQVLADSCEIRLFYEDFYGDSLSLMKLTTYELEKPMSEGIKYYTDFNPESAGIIRSDGIRKEHSFTLVNTPEKESSTDSYMDNICVKLNEPYTDKDGVTYNNYGTYVLRMYYSHPEYFKNGITFTNKVIPGFYFKMTGGMGGIAYVSSPQLNIYYRLYVNNKDSIAKRMTLFSGSEEVLQSTRVTNDQEVLSSLVADESCTYVKGPAGIYTEITLPVDEIMQNHQNDTVNSARLTLYRYNNHNQNAYNLSTPQQLLMIEKDSIGNFFEEGKIVNYKQSFISTYNSTSNYYLFGNIGALISYLYQMKAEGLKSDSEWEKHHPDWNKVLLVPVTAAVDGNNKITGISNDMTLTSTRLVGGKDALVISVIYSKFK